MNVGPWLYGQVCYDKINNYNASSVGVKTFKYFNGKSRFDQ